MNSSREISAKVVKHTQDMQQTLRASLLTPDQVTQALERFGADGNDSSKYFVDWDLDKALGKVLSDLPNGEHLVREVHASTKDFNCSKQFYNRKKTLENWKHFIDASVYRGDFTWNINFKVAAHILRECVHVKRLDPISITMDNIDVLFTNKEASAGIIAEGTKEENAQLCIDTANQIMNLIDSGEDFKNIWIPYCQFHRSQISKYVMDGCYSPDTLKKKDRLILGADGGSVTVEARYARPIINHMSEHWYSYSGGDDPTELRHKIQECKRSHQHWTSLDYSKFDQTVQSWVIKACFDIIKDFFDPKEHRRIDWICHNFIHSWLIYHGGIDQKHRGIPSGSHFTQVIGSMANALMMLTYISSRSPKHYSFEEKTQYVKDILRVPSNPGLNRTHLSMFVLGDDNLIFTDEPMNLGKLSTYLNRCFGVDVNPDKVDSGECESVDPTYLKRIWKWNGEYRDILDLVINVIHPEKARDYEGKGFSPWHIVYGLYLTYPLSFPHCEDWYLKKMHDAGGIDALRTLDRNDLPGSLKAYGDKVSGYLYNHAVAVLNSNNH